MIADTYWKACAFVKRGQVELISADKGYLHFQVKGFDVFRNDKKVWSCCKKQCSLFRGRGQECSHIRACKMWLKGKDL